MKSIEEKKKYSSGNIVLVALSSAIVAGSIVGIGEGIVLLCSMFSPKDFSVLLWGVVAYTIFAVIFGLGFGLLLWGIRLIFMKDKKISSQKLYYFSFYLTFVVMGFVIARFRVLRDLFKENLPPFSPKGILVQSAVFLGILLIGVVFFVIIRFIIDKSYKKFNTGFIFSLIWFLVLLLASIVINYIPYEPKAVASKINDVHSQKDPSLPNIVLVLVDTLRADHLSLYGYEKKTSPYLERLVEEAILFENAFANSTWTRPSVATVLTGRYPSSHKTMHKVDALPDEIVTVTEILKQKGYFTKGIVTNFNLAPYFNFHQGFDEYEYLEPRFMLWANDTISKFTLYNGLRLIKERFLTTYYNVDQFYRDARFLTDYTIRWLNSFSSLKSPYFLFIAYMDPHDPYFKHPYNGEAIARVSIGSPLPQDRNHIIDLYDGEIMYWDYHFYRFIQALKAKGDWDNTMVIVFSDHGEEFYEHGGWWHGTTLYEEQVHVPLIIKLPKSEKGGTKIKNWVQLVDITPTILSYVGVDPLPNFIQGKPLFERKGKEVVFMEEEHEGNILRGIRFLKDEEEWKYIEANKGNPRGVKPKELYNLVRDPYEKIELSKKEEEKVTYAEKLLREENNRAKRGAVHSQIINIDEGARDKLRSLGYIR